jgi:tetratricopeptide (TPR) repeat protein
MDAGELLERYEAIGDEADFVEAKRLYEQALAEGPDPELLRDYGYLLECHARRELREAVALYERAIELDPSDDKPHYQLISARTALWEAELAVDAYEARLAATPAEVREHRFLATAYLQVGAPAKAAAVVEAGLALAPQDAALTALRGEAKASLGDPEGALDDWSRALELEPEDIGPLYSTAFLLEREGRRGEAAEAWRRIIGWNDQRGYRLQSVWPREELERLTSEPERALPPPAGA